jgi:hypothetical protein
MKQLNSVIIEGDFQHFTSKKGVLPMTFLVDCNGQHFTISVGNSTMSEMVLKRKPQGMRIVGRLEKIGRNVCVSAEHIEFKPVSAKTVNKNTSTSASHR